MSAFWHPVQTSNGAMISKCKYGWMSVNCGTTSITATSARPVVDVGSDSDVAVSEITAVDERDPARTQES